MRFIIKVSLEQKSEPAAAAATDCCQLRNHEGDRTEGTWRALGVVDAARGCEAVRADDEPVRVRRSPRCQDRL